MVQCTVCEKYQIIYYGERLPLENENAKVKKTSKGLIIGIAVAVVIVIIGIVLFILKPWSAGYVASIDNQKITTQEYTVFSKFNMSQFLSNIQNNTTTADKYDWSQKVNGETAKDQVKKSTLDNIQEFKIQLAKAKEAGITLTDEEKKKSDETIDSSLGTSGNKADAEAAFETQYGVSLSEYKEIYRNLVLTQKYFNSERTKSKVSVTEDEIKKYYDDNKTSFDKVTISHIVISTVDSNGQSVSESKKSEAKKKAQDLVEKIKAGADIKALAKENSTSTSSTDNSELTFSKGQLSQQYPVLAGLENWAFENKAGDVGIVEAAYGFDVVKLEKRAETPYADMKEDIKSSLEYGKFSKEFNDKLESWKKEKRFEIVKNNSVIEKTDLNIYKV